MDKEKYKYISEKFTKIGVKATMVCSGTFSRYEFK